MARPTHDQILTKARAVCESYADVWQERRSIAAAREELLEWFMSKGGTTVDDAAKASLDAALALAWIETGIPSA